MKRICPFENNSFHHVYSKSIYRYELFTCPEEYQRMIQLIVFYQYDGHKQPFSQFILNKNNEQYMKTMSELYGQENSIVRLEAYCLMPTHIHLILQQLTDNGIPIFMGRLLNAYSRYFNLRHNRRGPLWESRFGNRVIGSEMVLNKCIEYVHYNPVKEALTKSPAQWPYSSAHHNPRG